jgi:dihydrofolate reductase
VPFLPADFHHGGSTLKNRRVRTAARSVDPHPPAAGVVLHAAVSLDGYLAGPNHDLGFLDDITGAAAVYEPFYAEVGALVMGRTTFDVVRDIAEQWPYPGKPCTVVTSRPLRDPPQDVTADAGNDLVALAHDLRRHGRVWVVGGGVLAGGLLAAGVLDEIDLVITPHVLGAGTPLWPSGTGRHRLRLADASDLGAGAVRVQYVVSLPSTEPVGSMADG